MIKNHLADFIKFSNTNKMQETATSSTITCSKYLNSWILTHFSFFVPTLKQLLRTLGTLARGPYDQQTPEILFHGYGEERVKERWTFVEGVADNENDDLTAQWETVKQSHIVQ